MLSTGRAEHRPLDPSWTTGIGDSYTVACFYSDILSPLFYSLPISVLGFFSCVPRLGTLVLRYDLWYKALYYSRTHLCVMNVFCTPYLRTRLNWGGKEGCSCSKILRDDTPLSHKCIPMFVFHTYSAIVPHTPSTSVIQHRRVSYLVLYQSDIA